MSKMYEVIDDGAGVDNDHRQVEITELKEVIEGEVVMPIVLKKRYADEIEKIDLAKKRANQIVDDLIAINEKTNLMISNIPEKI
jgi:hypothetical protein